MTYSYGDFKEALWTFTTKIIPSAPSHLQKSLLNIAWIMGNYSLSQEESEKLFFEIYEIWDKGSFKYEPRKELLAWCAWKLHVYLLFDQKEIAFQLFRQLMRTVRRGISEQDLNQLCSDSSTKFPLPRIPKEDIEFLYTLAKVCQSQRGGVTIRRLAGMQNLTHKKVEEYLTKFEITLGCIVAAEALGLYHLYVEVEIENEEKIYQFLELLKPFIIRSDFLSPLNQHLDGPKRISFRFHYPIEEKDQLFKWAIDNRVRLYRQIECHIYQNFNILHKESWHEKETSEEEQKIFHVTLINTKDQIEITEDIIRIIETYLIPTVFSKARVPATSDQLIPYKDLGILFGLREEQTRRMAARLFSNQILIRYFYSSILFSPSLMIEGPELELHTEAKKYLYARLESFLPFNEEIRTWEREKVYQLYSLDLSPDLLQKYSIRRIKRLHSGELPWIRADMYDFNQDSWKVPKLPTISDLL